MSAITAKGLHFVCERVCIVCPNHQDGVESGFSCMVNRWVEGGVVYFVCGVVLCVVRKFRE